MTDLVEFVRARLDEDRLAVTDVHHANCEKIDYLAGERTRCDCGWPEQLAAGIEAKQQLADAHERITEMWDQGNGLVDVELCRTCAYGASCDHCFERDDLPDVGWPCRPLRLLVSEFAAHRDYRSEWRVS